MRVWTVIEHADYQTVAIFQTEELAKQYVEREREHSREFYDRRGIVPPSWVLNNYDYGEEEVLDSLPPAAWE